MWVGVRFLGKREGYLTVALLNKYIHCIIKSISTTHRRWHIKPSKQALSPKQEQRAGKTLVFPPSAGPHGTQQKQVEEMSSHFAFCLACHFSPTNTPHAATPDMTRSIFVAKRARAFHHPQYVTHHDAAALRVIVQQAQSAQRFLVPQPVLRRVQCAVAAQHLQHTDKPCSGTQRRDTHGAYDSTHTVWVTQSLSSATLCVFPLCLLRSIDLFSRTFISG